MIQLTAAALGRHLQEVTEKLRGGMQGKIHEAIQQSVARIVVGGDGRLTIEAKPGGLLELDSDFTQSGCQEGCALIGPNALSAASRRWKVMIT